MDQAIVGQISVLTSSRVEPTGGPLWRDTGLPPRDPVDEWSGAKETAFNGCEQGGR